MDPMTIGALAGLGKSMLIDAPKAERDRKLAATTATLSPWTGMQPTMPQDANPFGSALQGGMAGAAFSQANPGMNQAAPAVASSGYAPGGTMNDVMTNQAVQGMGQQIPGQSAMKPKTFMSPYDNMRLG